jgi:hypothetical protein
MVNKTSGSFNSSVVDPHWLFNADPDPAVNLNADPDPGSQTNCDPVPCQTFKSQTVEFQN